MPGDPPVDARAGRLAAAGVVLAALALRTWGLAGVGVSHWDAGTYTAGPLGVGSYGRGDLAIYYAPPLVPATFGALLRAFGPDGRIAVAAVALCGAATVALVFEAARRWCGPLAACAGAAALAGLELHLAFSRQALTDVPFTLFFSLAAFAFAEGVRSGRAAAFAVAGLGAALASWTKYHGFFALALAGGWLACCFASGHIARERRPAALRGAALTAAIGAAALAALAAVIESRIGLAALRENNARWLVEPEPWVLARTARFVARCLAEWSSWPVLAAAAIGLARMLARRGAFDLLLLAWLALFLLALPFYTPYPRLLVPLAPPLALAAGVGAEEVVRFARARLGASGEPGGAARAAAALALLVPGALAARGGIALESRGYEDAARWLAAEPVSPDPDLAVAQHALLLGYAGSRQDVVTHDEPGALERLASGRWRYLIADLRLDKPASAPFRAWIEAHGAELELAATFANPLPETVLVNSHGFEGLDALRAGTLDAGRRTALTSIRVWRRRP